RQRRSRNLRNHVPRDVFGLALPPQPYSQCYRRVVVRARDVSSCEDHDHQRRPDSQRCQRTRSFSHYRAAYGEYQEERAHQFHDVLVHANSSSFPLLRGAVTDSAAQDTTEPIDCSSLEDGMTISGFGSPVDSTGVPNPDRVGSSSKTSIRMLERCDLTYSARAGILLPGLKREY